MSDLFGNFKRPRAEQKIIDRIISLIENSKNLFKEKNYSESLSGYEEAYQLLNDIWDIYPKIITLYMMMKGYYYTKQYLKVKSTMEMLEPLLQYIPNDKFDIFIKMKSKILIYQLILYFIYDELDNSLESVMGMIKYLTNHPTFSLEDKAKFFWKYIKSFLKITGIDKSNKFLLLKEGYDSMIVEQVKVKDDDHGKNDDDDSPPEKKINRLMANAYKTFMNSKLRGIIYEVLDKEFYFFKYHKINDKVMIFLHKNMTIFVRDNNRGKLVQLFHTFIVLNKMNLKKEYNMTLEQLVSEQKRRIEAFDGIFSNLVGAFNHIFKEYYAAEMPVISKKIERNNEKLKSFRFNITELKNLIKVRIKSPSNWEEELLDENNNKGHKKRKKGYSQDFKKSYIKEIKIPPNTEEMDKKILVDNFIQRRNLLNAGLKTDKKLLNIFRSNKLNLTNDILLTENNMNDFSVKLPNITKNNISRNNEEEKNIHKSYYQKKRYKIKLVKNLKLDNDILSISESIKSPKFKLRNINNYLISKILDVMHSFYMKEHDINQDENLNINFNINIKRKDFYEFNIPNYIMSYSTISKKGNQTENQDTFFYYNNFFLIKNLICFGVLDGHGKNGQDISEYVSILYPSYLFYLLLDDNLCERKVDINKTILKLMKIQESPDDIKDMFILRYIMHKFEIDFSYVPFISGNKNLLLHQIHEALSYSHKDLKKRYDVDIKSSGTTLCSAFILGSILYIVNVGDSRAVLGTYFSKVNIWKTKQLSVDHKPKNPKESKRILLHNGRIDKLKNEYGEDYGPYRVFEKESDSVYPGLATSRTIGDDDAKKLGVVFEPDLFKYELKEKDKVIIIGTDGLWDILSNEEAIQIVGECMDNNKKCQEAAKILVDYATKKVYKKYNIIIKDSESNSDAEDNQNNKEFMSKNHFNNDEIMKIIDDMTCIVIYLDIKK